MIMTARKATPSPLTPQGGVRRHGAAIYDEAPHDPYEAKGKYSEPTACSDCRAVFHRGRWTWADVPEGAHAALCPACHRVRDKLPAGHLILEGDFVDTRRDELARLARNEEAQEKALHPLHRIMDIEHEKGRVTVTTTDIHLARRIGEAVRHAYQGDLDLKYAKNEYMLRAHWRH